MKKRALALVTALCLALTLATPALAATTAATIKLSKTSGTVTVSKSSGKALTQMKDMRLYNGYHVTTAASSYAWMNLDDTKLIKQDVSSEVEVRKSGNNLEVNICSGNVFFNVSEKLNEKESLNISTSTMIVGIRGTAGYVCVRDRWTTEVTILEGTVQCSVTDPVTGQTKTQTIQGGQTATCVVYPQGQPGTKCDILMEHEPLPVTDIPGFVLTDVVRDMDLCERIEENTGTDILEELAAVVGGDPSGRSPDGSAASPEILGETERRETTEAAQAQQAQEAAEAQVENTVAAADKALIPEEEAPATGGGSTGGGSSGGGGSAAPTSITVTATDMTAERLQTLLGQYDVVNVEADPNIATYIMSIDTPLTVAAGKTLNVGSGVVMELDNAGTITIDGTVTASALVNMRDITVNSANTLHVTGDFTNDGTLTVTATGRVVVDGTFTSNGGLTLTDGAQVLAQNGFDGVTLPTNWVASAETTAYNGADYSYLMYMAPRTIILSANGGTLNGTDTALAIQTENGLLSALPADPTRTANTGGTATYTFAGWFTAADGGTQIDTATVFTGDTTVYAHWTIASGWDWALEGGVLTISGTGAMAAGSPPWNGSASTITSVIVEEGITSIGSFAFQNCAALKNITIPDSVTSIGSAAFDGCSSLTTVTIPANVTSIGNGAFARCTSLTGITIPNGVKSIGNGTFNGCTALTGLTIPTGVTSIETEAFYNCTGLESITIPASVKTIAASAFDGCTALKMITFGGTRLEWDAFAYDAPARVTVNCSDGVPAAYTVTFNANGGTLTGDSTAVTSVEGKLSTLPTKDDFTATRQANTDGTATYTFAGWFTAAEGGTEVTTATEFTADTTVYAHWTIDSGWDWELSADKTALRIFGKGDMKDFGGSSPSWNNDRESITSVTIDSGITRVGQGAFIGFTNLTTITLPQSITSIGSYAFQDCTALKSVTFSGTPTFDEIGLGAQVFLNCAALTSFTVPNGVTQVQQYTFSGCTGLKTVTIPASVTIVDAAAFEGCTALTGITYLGTRAQWATNTLAGNAPADVTVTCSDGDAVAYTITFDPSGGTLTGAATANTSVAGKLSALPTDPTRTANTDGTATYTFAGWFTTTADGEEKITESTVFTANTTVYAHWTMSDSGWDWELNADKTALRIFGNGAMKDFGGSNPPWIGSASTITSVTVEDGITNVGQGAFRGFTNLTTVNLPEGLKTIDSAAFGNCSSLTEIALPSTLTSLGTNFAFTGCTKLNNVVIPSGVTEIPQYTFQNCTSLTSITIPDSVTYIDAGAFDGCTNPITFTYNNGTSSSWTTLMGSVTVPNNSIVTCSDGTGTYSAANKKWEFVDNPATP